PLGGNRHGPVRTYLALMLTMLIGGLWHGANWTFVAWGGLHGVYLAVERGLRQRFSEYEPGRLALFALGVLTFVLVNIAWVFFRADSFDRAGSMLAGMFGWHHGAAPLLAGVDLLCVAIIVGGIVATHIWMRRRTLESMLARVPAPVLVLVWSLMAFAILIEQGSGHAFIYFQF
ncbi:MAG: MBOAT family protein, partial [Xanthomonadales bacterium]|nr:MBOAT family protein [Xanthomonadales bacterium]